MVALEVGEAYVGVALASALGGGAVDGEVGVVDVVTPQLGTLLTQCRCRIATTTDETSWQIDWLHEEAAQRVHSLEWCNSCHAIAGGNKRARHGRKGLEER